jgi:hypothetical protein
MRLGEAALLAAAEDDAIGAPRQLLRPAAPAAAAAPAGAASTRLGWPRGPPGPCSALRQRPAWQQAQRAKAKGCEAGAGPGGGAGG